MSKQNLKKYRHGQPDDGTMEATKQREPYMPPRLVYYDSITNRTGDEKGYWFGTQDIGS